MLARDKNGNIFQEFYAAVDESVIGEKYNPLTFSLVIAKYQGKCLLIKNSWRKQWEVPGGYLDEGETPRAAIMREMYEETGQCMDVVNFLGVTYWDQTIVLWHWSLGMIGVASSLTYKVLEKTSEGKTAWIPGQDTVLRHPI